MENGIDSYEMTYFRIGDLKLFGSRSHWAVCWQIQKYSIVCVLFVQDWEECEDCTLALASSFVFLDRTSGGHQKAPSKVGWLLPRTFNSPAMYQTNPIYRTWKYDVVLL